MMEKVSQKATQRQRRREEKDQVKRVGPMLRQMRKNLKLRVALLWKTSGKR